MQLVLGVLLCAQHLQREVVHLKRVSSDCHSPFSVICTAFCSDACWLKANQSLSTREMSFVCFLTENFIETILVIIIFLNLLSETIQEKRKNHSSFVGSCLVSTVSRHVRYPQKEHINNHKVATERVCCVVKVEDLVLNKIPRE